MGSPSQDSLPFFDARAPLHTQLTAQRMNALVSYIRSLAPQMGTGMRFSRLSGGTAYSANRRVMPPPPQTFPFQVYLSSADTSAPKANIYAASRIYKTLGTASSTIVDLNTEFTLASNTYVWLEVAVSSLVAGTITRKTGTAWPSLVVTSGSPAVQTQFNVPIGRVAAAVATTSPIYSRVKPGFDFSISGTAYHFEQCLFDHLLIENRGSGSTPILYAFPWAGAV